MDCHYLSYILSSTLQLNNCTYSRGRAYNQIIIETIKENISYYIVLPCIVIRYTAELYQSLSFDYQIEGMNHCNFRPFTRTADYCIWQKKKSTDYPHWWITRTLCYSTFWWRKHDIKVIYFSLLKVVWSNFQKLKSFFVEFNGQRNSDTCTILCQY